GPTAAADPLLLYFTSGTTSQPKLVLHTHQSYPVDHLSTMFWIGLKPGDVVTSVNGEPIIGSGSLSSRIGMATPGEKVKLTVWRDRKPMEIDAKLGSAEESGKTVASAGGEVQPGQLGLALRPLTPDERKQAKIEQGLLIEGVAGPAARAGLTQGDVLLAINGQPVGSIEQVRGVMQSKPKSVALLVERDGQRIFVPVKLG
ncbi:MAG TPA: PDZ domain-containing protein, partial [Burkholderiaceae bacterium]|nr:PDZ domain-containing protein [Burkholderiaceae bacterium]